MLESGDVLATWALQAVPQPGRPIDAERLFDHRTAFLDYEGPLSAGRGSVTRWDGGTYRAMAQDDERWEVEIEGKRLVGRATLRRREAAEAQRWSFTFSEVSRDKSDSSDGPSGPEDDSVRPAR
jgi:hypothetical protein